MLFILLTVVFVPLSAVVHHLAHHFIKWRIVATDTDWTDELAAELLKIFDGMRFELRTLVPTGAGALA